VRKADSKQPTRITWSFIAFWSGVWHNFTQASAENDCKRWKIDETCKRKHEQDIKHNLNGGNWKKRITK